MDLKTKYPALAAVVPKGAGPCCMCHQRMSDQDGFQLCPDCQESINNSTGLGLDYASVASVIEDSKYPTVAEISGH